MFKWFPFLLGMLDEAKSSEKKSQGAMYYEVFETILVVIEPIYVASPYKSAPTLELH